MKRNTLLTVLVVTMLGLGFAGGSAQAESFFDVFFDVTVEDVEAPPYPSDEIVVRGSRDAAGLFDTEIVSMSLSGATGDMPLRMHASDSGGGPGLAGIDSFFDVFCDGDPGDFPAESFFDVFVEVDLPPLVAGAARLCGPPAYYPADSFFDVFVTIDIPDLGPTRYHIHGEIPLDQGLKFTGVSGGGQVAGDSFFDVFTELSIDGTLDPLKPLVRMTMTAQIVPEPAGLGLIGLMMMTLTRKRGL